MPAYAVQISTVANQTPSTVRVRFAAHREAENYARWLLRRNPGRVVSYYIVPLRDASANAEFVHNKLYA